MQQSQKRIESLDILRGLDLFLLVFFQPVLMQICNRVDNPMLNTISQWFSHADWEGLHLWDMVMPLFLFMAGASMPFAFSKYKTADSKWPVYRKVVKRFFILFILGMVVQGNLLGLDPQMFRFYSNTLQAIASGYLIAPMLMLHLGQRAQIIATCMLMLIYWIPMHFCGDYTAEGNFAEMVDRAVLGSHRDGVYWDEQGQWHYAPWYHYTWIWSSLTFCCTVAFVSFAGYMTKNGNNNRMATAQRLLLAAVRLSYTCESFDNLPTLPSASFALASTPFNCSITPSISATRSASDNCDENAARLLIIVSTSPALSPNPFAKRLSDARASSK